MPERSLKAYLILENGRIFKGRAFGCLKEAIGETVFCTSMVGYQETVTDPSYAGQIVMMTYPLIGNAGINLEDMESQTPRLKALIVREKCDKPNNWRCEMEIDGFLKQNKIMGIEGIDTRSVMRILREEGTMKAIVTMRNPIANADGVAELSKSQIKQKFESYNNKNIVREITAKEKYTIEGHAKSKTIGVIDLGMKAAILNELTSRGYKVTVYPAYTSAEEMLADKIDGVFISNGAGSPLDIPEIVAQVKVVIESGKPVFGVCLGHQVVSLALGCTVTKMKFGHHGGNYPVKDLKTGKVYITAQNNDFTVSNLPEGIEATFKNINDGTVEGLKSNGLPVFSVQFCPETAANPCHTGLVFDQFGAMVEGGKIHA
jgi:carbamoyl-phosphate synthase small subunit